MNQKSILAESPVVTYATLVGKVLQQQRKQHGVEQAQMAQTLGISQSAYSRLESGGSTLTVAQLRTAAQALKMPPHVLLMAADHLEAELNDSQEGVKVVTQKPNNAAAAIIGVGVLLALLANK